jgi:hypothetical protein
MNKSQHRLHWRCIFILLVFFNIFVLFILIYLIKIIIIIFQISLKSKKNTLASLYFHFS